MGGSLRSAYAPVTRLRWNLAAALLAAPLLLSSIRVSAKEPEGASTSDAARDEARRAIPMAKVDPAYRDSVRAVIGDPTLYRRLPTNVIDCRPELYTFLAQNPEVLVEVWRQLGISQVRLTRLDDKTFKLE